MIEVVGDSARGAELAFVRLMVDGDRIVSADAPGLDRPLDGLTLLEAAAVPGETLAADALANALGPVPAGPAAERACCSPEAVIAARETCHALGLPHVTLDFREEFRCAVVAPFVRGYARGETPNPCTRCNGSFRFAELLAFARRAGTSRLATGHYARVVQHKGRALLACAADPAK